MWPGQSDKKTRPKSWIGIIEKSVTILENETEYCSSPFLQRQFSEKIGQKYNSAALNIDWVSLLFLIHYFTVWPKWYEMFLRWFTELLFCYVCWYSAFVWKSNDEIWATFDASDKFWTKFENDSHSALLSFETWQFNRIKRGIWELVLLLTQWTGLISEKWIIFLTIHYKRIK